MRETILQKLSEIEQRENVTILYAVESGSRAWGVESPDSDYDVRFVYVRPATDYLKLEKPRDVIEWQLDDVLDINGWDLSKTLIQFHRGNATLFEWSNSPVVYKTTPQWQEVYAVAKQYFSEKTALHHYRGTASATWQQFLQGDQVRYKKYIYALRPLLACRYILEHHEVPPVRFEDLRQQSLPEQLRREIDKMMEVKLISGEKDLNPRLPAIHSFIESTIAQLSQLLRDYPDAPEKSWEPLDAIFLKLLKENT